MTAPRSFSRNLRNASLRARKGRGLGAYRRTPPPGWRAGRLQGPWAKRPRDREQAFPGSRPGWPQSVAAGPWRAARRRPPAGRWWWPAGRSRPRQTQRSWKRAHASPRPPRRAPAGLSPGPKAPGTRSVRLALQGHTHPPWLSSFGPESLRVSLRRSHLFSWTGATSEWGTWGQRATFAGRWPWRRSGQLRAGRDAELALGWRGGRGGTEAAAFQTEAELFQAFKAARTRLSLPSLPPSRRPPPCEELRARALALARPAFQVPWLPVARGMDTANPPLAERAALSRVCETLQPGSLISPGSAPSTDPHTNPEFSDCWTEPTCYSLPLSPPGYVLRCLHFPCISTCTVTRPRFWAYEREWAIWEETKWTETCSSPTNWVHPTIPAFIRSCAITGHTHPTLYPNPRLRSL